MSSDPLEPLYGAWEEPKHHRVKGEGGGPAIVQAGRRASQAFLVPYIRNRVSDWRDTGYFGATETTKELLGWWFNSAHRTEDGEFRYYFAQREAVETAIWLYEVAKYRSLSDMAASLVPDDRPDYDVTVKGIPEDQDRWSRICSKIATGGGKTKCMSLLIAWSFFNSVRENSADYARHFVIVAPNLIVLDRLKSDFEGGEVFRSGLVVPPALEADFDLETVLQDDSGGSASTGCVYLTNIHRLFERAKEAKTGEEPPSWAGPAVKKAQVYKLGERLRERISSHPSIMVLNDEAHHLHDPKSAWSDAVSALHHQSVSKGNAGVMLQADFTATPKHNDGKLFLHVVSDFPLGEAVDAGIVKVPVLGKSKAIIRDDLADNAFDEYRAHLSIGYQQYKKSYKEWADTRKPILFVMTETAEKANEIAAALNALDKWPGDSEPNLLRGRVLNLHTRLKGKIKKVKKGGLERREFVYDETGNGISDEDLKVLREWSQQLDSPDSPYLCVVSVLMLREGWDVKNVTTIVPLRPYVARSNILAEQALGRGLRRMLGPGEALERVTVVEHPAFSDLYQQELSSEGLELLVESLEDVKPKTVTIFVDRRDKQVDELDILVPAVSDSIEASTEVDGLDFQDISLRARNIFEPLDIKGKRNGPVVLTETTLLTDELVSSSEIAPELFSTAIAAVSGYVARLEKECKVRGTHPTLAPLVRRFIEEVLFERPVDIYSGDVDHRMRDADVVECILQTFVPLIRDKTITTEMRRQLGWQSRLSGWKNYQATFTPDRPCVAAQKTLFNLVPCDSRYEGEFAKFLDDCDDVAAFARNSGPQKLVLDYLSPAGKPAFYWPDFFVRTSAGDNCLVELKGVEDRTVAEKARAAIEWCKAASSENLRWQYVYVPQDLFNDLGHPSVETLISACQPRLANLLGPGGATNPELRVDDLPVEDRRPKTAQFTAGLDFDALSPAMQKFVEQAVNQLEYDERMQNDRLSPAFNVLLEPFEVLCGELLRRELAASVPDSFDGRRNFFDPYLYDLPNKWQTELRKHQKYLSKNLAGRNFCNRIGNLLFCLAFSTQAELLHAKLGGIWDEVESAFSVPAMQDLRVKLDEVNQFRNRKIVHVENPLTDSQEADEHLRQWIDCLIDLFRAARKP